MPPAHTCETLISFSRTVSSMGTGGQCLFCVLVLQESPMPDPSELFTNVYVKGYGAEVDSIS